MSEEADVVVIGSGIAGALCAYKLARQGFRVLILEAGPRIERTKVVQAFAALPRSTFSIGFPNPSWAPRPEWGNGDDRYIRQTGPIANRSEYLRVVGGTTWHWGGAADRLLPSDFRLRSTYGVGMDWPFDYAELEPYYCEAEQEIGVAGSAQADAATPRSAPYPFPPVPLSYADRIMADRLRQIGIAAVPRSSARNTLSSGDRPRCEGFGTCMPICPTGAMYSAIIHIDKAERAGARLLAEHRVDRLETDSSGRIRAAHFTRSDGSTDSARGNIFVLAANTIESPRLLLASAGEAWPRGLANTSDQVGRNYMDHPTVQAVFETPYPLYGGRGPYETCKIDAYRDGAWRDRESAMMIVFDNSAPHLDQVTLTALQEGLMPPKLDGEIRHRSSHIGALLAFTEQLPDGNNRVTLDWSDRDSAGQPRICLHYDIGPYEYRALARMEDILRTFARQLEAQRLHVSRLFGLHHTYGTLRMGADPKKSVVDATGRAHDHANLFVVGGAVFPTSGACAPTLTIAALSLRLAAAIQRQPR